ncbi:MAG: PepSY domain-containing protein [Arenicella sp.]|nr:PepSY domain-containing protein [Arenicella sp.]
MFKRNNSRPRGSQRNGKLPGRRWHRRLGIISALPVLLLAVTGIALNHDERLSGLDGFVQSSWLLDWYDIGAPGEVFGSDTAGVELLSADGFILIGGEAKLFDQAPLIGTLMHQDLLHVITETEMHIFTSERQLVESLSLPERISGVWLTSEASIIQFQPDKTLYSIDTLSEVPHNIEPIITGNLSDQLQQRPETASGFRRLMLPRSRVLQDVHSGRFFGQAGVLLMDLFALLFIVLAITGIRMWWRRSR